jgi:translation initiation factor 2-alpha kinase 3
LHTDRYIREFIELDVVGKGGYGTVFKVKHKLDNSFYAVKRIVVSPARLQRIQQNGPKEMEKMLEEVRALARFDHGNVVRYYNSWLEFTTSPSCVPLPNTPFFRNDKLLEHVSSSDGHISDLHADLGSLSVEDKFGSQPDSAAGIVFEYSDADTGAGADGSISTENKTRPTRRNRSSSQATVGTQSSVRSRMSGIESVNGEEDDGIETIPRDHHPQYPDPSTEVSESMLSNSDAPNHFLASLGNGPALTLNVQMSLYDTNLADFLSPQPSPTPANVLQHCFHPCISLELLANIISGVEYLHAQGVVHRDLKPANIFLSLSTSKIPPSGSLDLSTCQVCPSRDCVYITPRIGDFGLVAALGEGCFTVDTTAKPVGTEFYRPEGADARVSEKLDVFALGVVFFETLQRFSTRMERAETLTRLRQGEYPDKFADRVGPEVQDLISSMIQRDEEKRLTCEDVKHRLRKIIGNWPSDEKDTRV